jgi:hypothetical protein
MGVAYNVAKENGRFVMGICPETYKDGLDSLSCDATEVVSSIRESTMAIYHNCDAILILP